MNAKSFGATRTTSPYSFSAFSTTKGYLPVNLKLSDDNLVEVRSTARITTPISELGQEEDKPMIKSAHMERTPRPTHI